MAADMCLGHETEEEVMTVIARGSCAAIASFRRSGIDPDQFRDEPRAALGTDASAPVIMKDAYSFRYGRCGPGCRLSQALDAYCRIFKRCGLEFLPVEAHSGAMGGSQSHEFMVEVRGLARIG